MKKNYLIFATLILISFNSLAQTYVFQFKPWESRDWGYMNVNGEIIIEPQHRKCYDFTEEGLALVYYSRRNHYDIINLNNEVLDVEPKKLIVKEVFGYGAQGYSSGILVVRIKTRWGAIDKDGKIIVPVKYDFISRFIDGYATARLKDKFYVIDSLGNEIQINENEIIKISKFDEGMSLYNNKKELMGFINRQGEVVIPAKYKKLGYFNAGVAWARDVDGKIGFINKNGEWIIEPKFLAVKDFDPISQLAKASVDEFWGYINKKGEWVIEPKFLEVRDFDPVSQLAKARVNETWGYINKKGEIRYVENMKKIYDYSEGLAMAVTLDVLFGFLDENQNWIIRPQFEAARDFKNGYAAAKLDGKWGIIDKSGEWVIEPEYSGIKDVVKISKQ